MAEKLYLHKSNNSLWYIALIVILVAALGIWFAFSLNVDVFNESIKRDEPIFLLIAIDDTSELLLSEVLILNPKTINSALVAVPKETGMLIPSLDKMERLEVLYNPEDRSAYIEELGKLLGHQIDFTLRFEIDNFEKFVDGLGGLDLFIPTAIDDVIEETHYLFPPGAVWLDGAKARSYVEYRPVKENIIERSNREERIIQSLLKGIGGMVEKPIYEDMFPYMKPLISSDFDQRSLATFFSIIAHIDTERLILQNILGNTRQVDGQDILFPYYEGRLIKETLVRIIDTLGREDEFNENILTVRVEIQNGTEVNGLASRTAQLFENFGFRVVAVKNADRNDYDTTVVLDRRRNPEVAKRVADLIRCQQIYSDMNADQDETIDVTVILGKDFGGRYVK